MSYHQRSSETSPNLGDDEAEFLGEKESAIEKSNQSEDGNNDSG